MDTDSDYDTGYDDDSESGDTDSNHTDSVDTDSDDTRSDDDTDGFHVTDDSDGSDYTDSGDDGMRPKTAPKMFLEQEFQIESRTFHFVPEI